jgi:hypothetical protein
VAVCLKPFCKYDDSLDAFGVHGVGGFLGALLTGILVAPQFYKAGSGSELATAELPRVLVQFLAATVAVVLAFVVTFVLVKFIDSVWGFCLDPRSESEGLDRSEHGEVGFDLGPALELAAERAPQEPRAARVPPDGQKRFTVVVQGAKNGELIHAWSDLCQAGPKPPSPEFRAVYPNVTTVQGNRFRFRGGDPAFMRQNLERLLQDNLTGFAIRAHVES